MGSIQEEQLQNLYDGWEDNQKNSWKTLDWGECPECGADAEVFTDNEKPNYVYDGDKCRCTECGLKGSANTDGENDNAYIDWHS